MKTTYTFHTTLKCSGCVAAVKPVLDAEKRIVHWAADVSGNPKTLTVEGEDITAEEVRRLLQRAGYDGQLAGA